MFRRPLPTPAVGVWLVEERIVPVVHGRAAAGWVDAAPAATERLKRIVEGTLARFKVRGRAYGVGVGVGVGAKVGLGLGSTCRRRAAWREGRAK